MILDFNEAPRTRICLCIIISEPLFPGPHLSACIHNIKALSLSRTAPNLIFNPSLSSSSSIAGRKKERAIRSPRDYNAVKTDASLGLIKLVAAISLSLSTCFRFKFGHKLIKKLGPTIERRWPYCEIIKQSARARAASTRPSPDSCNFVINDRRRERSISPLRRGEINLVCHDVGGLVQSVG